MSAGTIERRDVYAIVTEKIAEQLEAGVVPWHKPWASETGLPRSLTSGKLYRGVNPFLLGCESMAKGFESPWWLTFKQAAERGGNVRKGEHGSLVVFWKRLDGIKRVKLRNDETGELETWATDGPPMVLRYYTVFNAEQCDGIDYPKAAQVSHEWDSLESCESIVGGYLARGPRLIEGGAAAFYKPSVDEVHLPLRERFESVERYYSTAFHELTHSTGHARRLARKDLLESHAFGDANYSREELVAEMGAAMLCGVAGIDQVTVPQSAAYIASWLRALRDDRRLVVTAAAQAQKAADLIQGISYEVSEPLAA